MMVVDLWNFEGDGGGLEKEDGNVDEDSGGC